MIRVQCISSTNLVPRRARIAGDGRGARPDTRRALLIIFSAAMTFFSTVTPGAVPAPNPRAAAADFRALAGPALTGLEKPNTTRAGPSILELEYFFSSSSSARVLVYLPLIKDLGLAPAPEITVTGVLDKSGRNYYDAASSFEKGIFLRANLSRVQTPVPHFSGLRDVQFKPGLRERDLQKIEGRLRVSIPVDAKPILFEAGDSGKEKPVYDATITLKSLSGAVAVLHYRGESANMLGVRGYGRDGAPVAVKSSQLPLRNRAVDLDFHVRFMAPVSKVEAMVAAKVVAQAFPFSLERGAVAGAPGAATAMPASAAAPAAAAVPRELAKAEPRAQASAPARPVAASPPPAPAAKTKSEPKAKAPRRRVPPPASRPEPKPAAAAAPAEEAKVITPKFNDVMTAVIYEDESAVRQLLDLGWWVDKPSSVGYTPLMAAVMRGNVRIVQLLLERGADPNARGPGGVTALALARERDDTASAALLEQHGAR
jgi:hypothetical protein